MKFESQFALCLLSLYCYCFIVSPFSYTRIIWLDFNKGFFHSFLMLGEWVVWFFVSLQMKLWTKLIWTLLNKLFNTSSIHVDSYTTYYITRENRAFQTDRERDINPTIFIFNFLNKLTTFKTSSVILISSHSQLTSKNILWNFFNLFSQTSKGFNIQLSLNAIIMVHDTRLHLM